jgi:RNA polymerase sigma-70 factor (ECF subfamily)
MGPNRLDTKSEMELLSCARKLDEAAISEIYDRISPAIYSFAIRQTGDTNLAEECVADTFFRFLRSLRSGQGPTDHLKAYLYRIAHNWINDHYRYARPEEALNPELPARAGSEPHIAVSTALDQQELRNALSLLTPDQRQVIVLKYLEEMGNSEIALVLQKPVGAVKALQHRALDALRLILSPNEISETKAEGFENKSGFE